MTDSNNHENDPKVDPYVEEGIYAAAREMIEDGLLVETVDEQGNKVWRLTRKGRDQTRKRRRKRKGR
jgi:DNA-binding PadR family transcriptional regulator